MTCILFSSLMTSRWMHLTTEGTSSPLVLSSIGEVIYPATIKTSSSVKESVVVTVYFLHKKMVLPVYVITV